MRTLLLAELRGSLGTWLGVSLAFVATNFALLLPALVSASASAAGGEYADGTRVLANTNIVFSALVGLAVLGTATNLALSARRGVLARLALGGATPRQIVGMAIAQLAAMSLLGSLVGTVLAALALRPTLVFLVDARRIEADENMAMIDPVYSLRAALTVVAIAVIVAIVGGLRQTLRASKVPPVEAVRQHASGEEEVRLSPRRIIGTLFTCLCLVGVYGSVIPMTEEVTPDTMSMLLQMSLLALLLLGILFSLLAPVVIRPLTFAWVRLLPLPLPSWQLARRTAHARAHRLVRSVIPVMMTIGMLLGMASMAAALTGTAHASGQDFQLNASGWRSLLTLVGLPLLVSLAGGVGSLIMMSKQRDTELALLAVVGATPRQRILVPVLEAVIISVTATLLGLAMATGAVGVLALGVPRLPGMVFGFEAPYGLFASAYLATSLITIAATALPTLRARRMSEPAVIARLVAD